MPIKLVPFIEAFNEYLTQEWKWTDGDRSFSLRKEWRSLSIQRLPLIFITFILGYEPEKVISILNDRREKKGLLFPVKERVMTSKEDDFICYKEKNPFFTFSKLSFVFSKYQTYLPALSFGSIGQLIIAMDTEKLYYDRKGVDSYISFFDISFDSIDLAEWIFYHRQELQKDGILPDFFESIEQIEKNSQD